MPRPPRIEFPGALNHVTSRGVAGAQVFPADEDRDAFLLLLGLIVRDLGWLCHAYCLMTTHYHLLVETPAPNLGAGLRRLNGVYAQTFNRIRSRAGHLFDARYHSVLIERESHLLEVARYIVLNPVRARICRDPAAWPWSSYRATAGLAPPPSFLATEWLLGQMATIRPHAQDRYRAFVADGLAGEPWRPPRGRAIGSAEFVRRLIQPRGQAPGSGTGA